MAQVHQLIMNHLPNKRKQSSRGWITFNSVCCHHRGHNHDKRHRGNLIISADGVVGYNCYNCGFKTRFNGLELSKNFESLLYWLGVPDDEVKVLKLELLKNKINGVESNTVNQLFSFSKQFKEIDLPTGAVSLASVTEWEDIPQDFLNVVQYLESRGSAVADNHEYHWSPNTKHDMNNRIIIPFYYEHQIVGWTARYAGVPPAGVPRYYNSELQPGYLFNNEAMEKYNRKFLLLVEGPFDAIAIDGVAALGSELSKEQLSWLLQCDKEIVVVPDRQKRNQGLIDVALDNNWAVSFPEWEDKVKDSAQASSLYGRLYTLRSILAGITKSPLEINVKRQMFKEK